MRIRNYRPDDAPAVGRLIADTYSDFNLGEFPAPIRRAMLGPFAHARSTDPTHRREIAAVIAADTVLVAVEDDEIVGVLRARPGRLASLFVSEAHHRRGIGSRLVGRFEQQVRSAGGGPVRVAATLFAVPFYQALSYRKTTGVRRLRSFDGEGLPFQPMIKTIVP